MIGKLKTGWRCKLMIAVLTLVSWFGNAAQNVVGCNPVYPQAATQEPRKAVNGAAGPATQATNEQETRTEETEAQETLGQAKRPPQRRALLIVVGAGGAPEYAESFVAWGERLRLTAGDQFEVTWIGPTTAAEQKSDSGESDLEKLQVAINQLTAAADELPTNASSKATTEPAETWLVLLGHGTDDGKVSKFNLRGPDLAAAKLSKLLAPVPGKVVVINCSSSSGAFAAKLKAAGRIVVTATKSGAQQNFARFGDYFSQTIGDPTYDLDKDQQTSLLEAFIAASAQAQQFYDQDGRLASELAMIDDNSDGLGTPANWFQGTRVVRRAVKGEADGLLANQVFFVRGEQEDQLSESQRRQRDELEQRLETLRLQKSQLDEAVYFAELEKILLPLAKLYQASERNAASGQNVK